MPIPVITVAQMCEWEQASWRAGRNEEAVMRAAGAAVARYVEKLMQPGSRILVLAGSGHNGDDAIFAAEKLNGEKQIIRIKSPKASMAEVREALATHPQLIIDGLFGIGLNRALDAAWLELIAAVNESNGRVVSVDVPSGLNADRGEPMPDAIRASITVTLGAAKYGLLQSPALPFVGRLEIAPDIGLIPCPSTSELNVAAESDFQHFPRPRTVTSHKGTFGHLAIVAGSLGYHGAAVLASRGAQRAQPGLITVITSSNAYVPVASQCQAVMVHRYDDTPSLPEKCSAVLAGPGLAGLDVPPELPTFVRELWQRSDLPVIVDASGLPWLAKGAAQTKAPRVITPHPGEAARLLGTSSEAIQSDRVGAVRKLSSQYGGCYVVLKGHQTIIGKADGPLSINNSGNPYLGQGGTGDLLAGYLAGFLAQPALQKDVVRTISFAVWQHGHAADELSATRSAWVVEDLAEHLGRS